MKISIVVLAGIWAYQAAQASTAPATSKSAQVADKKWGTFDIHVRSNNSAEGEPVDLDLALTCLDQRKKRNEAKPQVENILTKEKICALNDYKFDSAKKTLTLIFSTTANGGAKACNEQWTQEFDMKLLCKKWVESEA